MQWCWAGVGGRGATWVEWPTLLAPQQFNMSRGSVRGCAPPNGVRPCIPPIPPMSSEYPCLETTRRLGVLTIWIRCRVKGGDIGNWGIGRGH